MREVVSGQISVDVSPYLQEIEQIQRNLHVNRTAAVRLLLRVAFEQAGYVDRVNYDALGILAKAKDQRLPSTPPGLLVWARGGTPTMDIPGKPIPSRPTRRKF